MPRAADPPPAPRSAQRTAKTGAKTKKPRAKRPPADGQVRLTGDRLVVRTPDNGERTSSGGLLIPATAMPAPKRLHVGRRCVDRSRRAGRQARDRVLFLPQSGLEVELEGEDVLLLRERDIQAVQSPSSDGKDHPPGQYL